MNTGIGRRVFAQCYGDGNMTVQLKPNAEELIEMITLYAYLYLIACLL